MKFLYGQNDLKFLFFLDFLRIFSEVVEEETERLGRLGCIASINNPADQSVAGTAHNRKLLSYCRFVE